MNTDIRLSVNFWEHHKTVKLKRRLGPSGPEHLIRIWCYAAEHRPDGALYNMDNEDIAIIARFDGDSEQFVSVLTELKWLDRRDDGILTIHDWEQHNSWAAKADDRSDQARFARMAKTHPDLYESLKAQGVTAVSREEYDDLTSTQRSVNDRSTTVQRKVNRRLTPSPAPSPSPKEEKQESGASCDEKAPSHSPPECAADVPSTVPCDRDEKTSSSPPKSLPPHKRIHLDITTHLWEGITQIDMEALKRAYPACCISTELNRMAEWIKANPTKRKTNWYRFIVNWLNRTQNGGGTRTAHQQAVDDENWKWDPTRTMEA